MTNARDVRYLRYLRYLARGPPADRRRGPLSPAVPERLIGVLVSLPVSLPVSLARWYRVGTALTPALALAPRMVCDTAVCNWDG